MAQFAVFAEGIELDLLSELDSKARRSAASKALNKIARDARSEAAKRILRQVALPASYVQPGNRRLYVSKPATANSLEARITAQGRATSLARFMTGGAKPGGRGGVTVAVKPGQARFMRRAFVMRLRAGNQFTDTQFNLGLAIRLRPGESLQNKLRARKVENGLYLLYGPSVDQIFRDNSGEGVANDIAPQTADALAAEFARLIGD